MGPEDMNSIDCIYRGNCLPLGGQSVWATSSSHDNNNNNNDNDNDNDNEKIILFAMAMDSRSDIYDITNGQTGVTLSIFLSALNTLYNAHQHPPSSSTTTTTNDDDDDWYDSITNHTRFVVAFFQGEQWGRSGSRSWVSDIQDFRCLQEVSKESSPFNDRMCTSPVKVG